MAAGTAQILACMLVGSPNQIPRHPNFLRQLGEANPALSHGRSGQEAPAGQAIRPQSQTCRATGQAASVVHNALVTGLPEVGLTEETARLLRGLVRPQNDAPSLNQPAHVSRMPTADLFRLHSIQDPVEKLRDRMSSRLRRLTRRGTAQDPTEPLSPTEGLTLLTTSGPTSGLITATSPPSTFTGASEDVTTLPHLLQDLRDILQAVQHIPAPTEASQQPSHECPHCEARFVSEYGLHMHVTRMHRDKVDRLDRYIPGDFDRSLHAKDGMPICAACGKEFKQWKGLRDHLLSGACTRPDRLRALSTTPEAQVLSGSTSSGSRHWRR